MRKTIVFILSTPFAGSHYLSLLLGSHTQVLHLGELKNVKTVRPPKKKNKRRQFNITPSPILEGIGPENHHDAFDIISARVPAETTVLIDNSKRVYWAERFVNDARYDKKYIHLIRDPRAIVRRSKLGSHFRKRARHRWRLFKESTTIGWRAFFMAEELLWAHLWARQNQAITRFIRRHQLDHQVITYRDLATNTAAEVERTMNWLGLSFEPAQLDYWNFDHIGTQKREYEWVKAQKTSYFDVRWKDELSPQLQAAVLSQPAVASYLAELGLGIMDDGLTRPAPVLSTSEAADAA